MGLGEDQEQQAVVVVLVVVLVEAGTACLCPSLMVSSLGWVGPQGQGGLVKFES